MWSDGSQKLTFEDGRKAKSMSSYDADGVAIFSPACVEVQTTSPSYQAPVRGESAMSHVQRTNGGKTWCIPKTGAHEEVSQANIDYVCGLGLD
ncbi:hypothetical protein Tco_1376857 [Tanacetum coccineum]